MLGADLRLSASRGFLASRAEACRFRFTCLDESGHDWRPRDTDTRQARRASSALPDASWQNNCLPTVFGARFRASLQAATWSEWWPSYHCIGSEADGGRRWADCIGRLHDSASSFNPKVVVSRLHRPDEVKEERQGRKKALSYSRN